MRDVNGRVIGASKICRDIRGAEAGGGKVTGYGKTGGNWSARPTIAHEINNPLESLTNLLYLARKDSGLSRRTARYLQTADQELERIAHLAEQTLGFYRDSNQPSRFKISEAAGEVLTIYSRRIASRNIEVKKQLGPDTEVFGSSGEFRQVLSNLLVNAIDAMEQSGGRLVLRARRVYNPANPALRESRSALPILERGSPLNTNERSSRPFILPAKIGTGLGLWLSHLL